MKAWARPVLIIGTKDVPRGDGSRVFFDVLLRVRTAGHKGIRPVPRWKCRRKFQREFVRSGLIPAEFGHDLGSATIGIRTPTWVRMPPPDCNRMKELLAKRREFFNNNEAVFREAIGINHVRTKRKSFAGQYQRADAAGLHRLLAVGHHRPRAARRPRRPQARAAPHPVHDVARTGSCTTAPTASARRSSAM